MTDKKKAFEADCIDWMSHGVKPNLEILTDKHGISDREFADVVNDASARSYVLMVKQIREALAGGDSNVIDDAAISEYVAASFVLHFITKDLRKNPNINFGGVKKTTKKFIAGATADFKNQFNEKG